MPEFFDLLSSRPWTSTLIGASLAALAALILHRILAAVLRRLTQRLLPLYYMFDKSRVAAGWALPLLAMQASWQAAPNDLPYISLVRHVNGVLLIAAVTWLAARIVKGLGEGVIAQHPFEVADNLQARRVLTQTRVLTRTAMTVIVIIGVAMILMTFPGARQVGASLLASAGVIGLVAGLAAKSVFSNLIAGLQIALTQPIRIDDVLVVEGEWGRVEEITGTFVVLKIWDDRRLILPLSYFIEKPFQNWTRQSSALLGSLFLYVDYTMPLDALREELARVIKLSKDWDGRFFNLQLTDITERTMQVRILCTAASSGQAFDLRCYLREAMVSFMQREYPQHLPRMRIEDGDPSPARPMPIGGEAIHSA